MRSFLFGCCSMVSVALLGCATADAQKTLFYMQDARASVESFEQHKNKIDTLVPTWYSVDGNGLVTGEPDPLVLPEAKAAHISVVPIVALFDKDALHRLASDTHAVDAMAASLVSESVANGYDGFQLDIEDVMWTDRDLLSALVQRTAAAMHARHLQLQIAICPNAPGHAGKTAFGKWIFEEWRLGYDYKAIGDAVDLFCLMTYDQHTRWTMPGPVGGWTWTVENLDYALQFVPKEKLSLGIALYGYHWYTGDPGNGKAEKKPNPTADYISYPNAMLLAKTYSAKPQWDEVDHTPFFFFYRDDMREWIFYTDRRAFMDRYDLARDRHLEGICAWVLGEEDPAIWDAIPARR